MFLLGLIIHALMEAMIKVRIGASARTNPNAFNEPARTMRGLHGENSSL